MSFQGCEFVNPIQGGHGWAMGTSPNLKLDNWIVVFFFVGV